MQRSKLLKIVGSIIAITLILVLATPMTAQTAAQEGRVRVWVEYQPGTAGQVEAALNSSHAEFHYRFEDMNAFVVSFPEAALAGISRNPNVVMIEEDAERYLDSQEVPYGIDMVQARDVWDADGDGAVDDGAPTGAGMLVCIIDSGLYTEHEDLQAINVIGGYPEGEYNRDACGHGTHVAGTIAAANNDLGVVGVTPAAVDVYVVKVFGDDCAWESTYASTLAFAANKCMDAGADIISMSLGGGKPNTLEERTFDTAYSQGILSVAAAGNDGVSDLHYPSSYDSVVAVGALDENKVIADFSQFNETVELAAPGVHVLSTVPFVSTNTLTVDGVEYQANHIEYAAYTGLDGVTAGLVDGGLCTATGDWAGSTVLCERGDISFYDKVMNVQNSGGVGAVIYNNAPGNFLGTLV